LFRFSIHWILIMKMMVFHNKWDVLVKSSKNLVYIY